MSPYAGWHPDPNDPQSQRFWDGARWTVHTKPARRSREVTASYATPVVQSHDPYQPGFDFGRVARTVRESWTPHTLEAFPTWLAIALHFLTMGLFTTLYHGLKHSHLPLVKRDDFSAGKAIGFLLIPFFNFYWLFVFWLRLADRINFQYRLHGAAGGVPRGLVLATCVAQVIPIVSVLAALVLVPIMSGLIQSATNRLVKSESVVRYIAMNNHPAGPAGSR